MKNLLLLILVLTVIPFSYSNGIWTYAEDIRAGVFGEREVSESDSYTFNNIVYFNRNTFVNSELLVDGDVTGNRFISAENSSFFLNPSGVSNLNRIVTNRVFSPDSSDFYLRPAHTSILNRLEVTNLDVSSILTYQGQELDNRYILEGQPNSITNIMLQDNSITTNKIQSSTIQIGDLDINSVDSRYLRRDGGNSMIGNLNMGSNDINNVNTLRVSSIIFQGGVVVGSGSGGSGSGGGGSSLSTPPSCNSGEALSWNGGWICVDTSSGGGGGVDLSDIQDEFVDRAGDSMTGDLNMQNNRIRNVAPPINPNDVATREFVEQNTASGSLASFKHHDRLVRAGVSMPQITVSGGMDKWPDYIYCRTSTTEWILELSFVDNNIDYRGNAVNNQRRVRFNDDGSFHSRNGITDCGSSPSLNIVQICNQGRCSN